jgi:hypothetical protein
MRCADCNARAASDRALDMAAACRGAARACRGDGEEDGGAFFDAAAKGHTFRSRELRYDANGGHVPPGGWPSG